MYGGRGGGGGGALPGVPLMFHVGDPAKGGFLSGDFRYYEASDPQSFDPLSAMGLE